jgi:hypothetical protein
MTTPKINRQRFASYAALIVLALLTLRIPTVQSVIAGALIEFIEITEKILRFPYALLDHDHCFSLDRLDPTCPPYL